MLKVDYSFVNQSHLLLSYEWAEKTKFQRHIDYINTPIYKVLGGKEIHVLSESPLKITVDPLEAKGYKKCFWTLVALTATPILAITFFIKWLDHSYHDNIVNNIRDAAATKIQPVYRGYIVRKRIRKAKELQKEWENSVLGQLSLGISLLGQFVQKNFNFTATVAKAAYNHPKAAGVVALGKIYEVLLLHPKESAKGIECVMKMAGLA